MIFEGEYKNGIKNGKGKEYEKNKLLFEEEYKNGLRNGKGKEYNNQGHLLYEGTYLEGARWNGKFYLKDWEGRYKREYINGKLICKIYVGNKLVFEGEYKNGQRNGKGKEYKNNK